MVCDGDSFMAGTFHYYSSIFHGNISILLFLSDQQNTVWWESEKQRKKLEIRGKNWSTFVRHGRINSRSLREGGGGGLLRLLHLEHL